MSHLTLDSQRLVGNAHGAARLPGRVSTLASGHYTLHLPAAGRRRHEGADLVNVTGLDKDKIELVAQDVGGSFGVRGAAYPEYFALMIAARKARPAGQMGRRRAAKPS